MNCYIYGWLDTLLYYGSFDDYAKKLVKGMAEECKRGATNWPNDGCVLVTDVNDDGDFIFEVAEIEG